MNKGNPLTTVSHKMEVVQLASKALQSPHPYDPSYEVEVRLDEPLWTCLPGPQEVAMEMMSYCMELDCLILSTMKSPETPLEDTTDRKVSFERGFSARAVSIIERMKECLVKHSVKQDLKEYLHATGLSALLPRVAGHVTNPDQSCDHLSTVEMDGYFSQISKLNALMAMSQQLNTDAMNPTAHKYTAHQIALLYTCVNQLGAPVAHYKKDIESHFKSIKSLQARLGIGQQGLTVELQQWLDGVTSQLTAEALSFNPSLTHDLSPVVRTSQLTNEPN